MIRTGLVALAFVVSGPALAADLLVEVSEETPAAVYDWTGFYAGVQGGGAAAASLFSQRDAAGAVVGPLQQTFNDWGGLFGVHAGYLHQAGNFVLGVEGDVNWVGLNGPFTQFTPLAADDFRVSISALGSIRGKLGVAADKFLIYATAGVAAANVNTQYRAPAGGPDGFNYGGINFGWTAGAGASYAVTENVVLTGEYRYTSITSSGPVLVVNNLGVTSATTESAIQTGTVGVSFKF